MCSRPLATDPRDLKRVPISVSPKPLWFASPHTTRHGSCASSSNRIVDPSTSPLNMAQDAISSGIVRPRSNCHFHWRNLTSFRNKHGSSLREFSLFDQMQRTRKVGTDYLIALRIRIRWEARHDLDGHGREPAKADYFHRSSSSAGSRRSRRLRTASASRSNIYYRSRAQGRVQFEKDARFWRDAVEAV